MSNGAITYDDLMVFMEKMRNQRTVDPCPRDWRVTPQEYKLLQEVAKDPEIAYLLGIYPSTFNFEHIVMDKYIRTPLPNWKAKIFGASK